MIVDCLKNWDSYFSGEDWKCAFEFLMSLGPDSEEKEYPLKGKDIFARIMSYETRLPAAAMLEAHRKYVDIQTVLVAAEAIEWFPVDTLEVKMPYDTAKDVEFYNRPRQGPGRIDIHPGTFVIFFPKDAHMPQLVAGTTPELVKKVVVKINVELVKPPLKIPGT